MFQSLISLLIEKQTPPFPQYGRASTTIIVTARQFHFTYVISGGAIICVYNDNMNINISTTDKITIALYNFIY